MFAIIALLVAGTDPAMEAWAAKRKAYTDCIVEQSVRLGQGNSESGETILKAAAGKCQLEEIEFEQVTRAQNIALRMNGEAGGVAKVRRDAGDRAVAALLDARASK